MKKYSMKRAVVIEDVPDLLKRMRVLLEHEGFEVFGASNGEAGLKLARDHKPDVICVDLTLPKLSGFDVAREVRVARPSVPIVVISGGLWNRELYDPLRIGEFLLKPQALRELGPTLRRLLDALSHKNTNDANATGAS